MSDRKRLLGPADSRIPETGVRSETFKKENINIEKKPDDEVRKIFLKRGLEKDSNGSAYLEAGDHIIQVSVFGPKPIRGIFSERGSLSVECKFLPYIAQPGEMKYNGKMPRSNYNARTSLTMVEHKLSNYLETTLLPSIILERYPKSSIEIFVTVLSTSSDDGTGKSILNLANWIVVCASLALVDSQIELKDIVSSGHARLNHSNGKIILDPLFDSHDDDRFTECLVSSMNLRNDEIIGFWIDGEWKGLEEENIDNLVEEALKVSKLVRSNINSYLMQTLESETMF